MEHLLKHLAFDMDLCTYLVLFVPYSILAGDVDHVQPCPAAVSRRAKKLLDMHLSCQRLDKRLKTEHFSEEKTSSSAFDWRRELDELHKKRCLLQNNQITANKFDVNQIKP